MSEYLPKEVRGALAAGQGSGAGQGNGRGGKHGSDGREGSRLRLVAGGREYAVLRQWTRGFAVDLDVAPRLRGLVDLYDGQRHLCKALVLASRDEDGERLFEFKFSNTAMVTPPAVDFAREPAIGEG